MKKINNIVIKDFKETYKDFCTLGSLLYKTSQEKLVKDFYMYDNLQNINSNLDDLSRFINILFKELVQDTSYKQLLSVEDNDIILELFENILSNYTNNFTSKQYFEVLSWTYTYAVINVKYCKVQKIAEIFFNELSKENEFSEIIPKTHILKKYTIKNKKLNQEQFIYDFLKLPEVKTFIGYIQDYKLDFSGSGQQLIAVLINDKEFLSFSGVQQIEKTSLGGYDKVLEIFNERYTKKNDYADINKLLDIIADDILREGVRNIIFSRSLVKNDLMVKGYSGTLFGSAEKISKRIKDYLQFNTYNIYYGNTMLVKQISKTSKQIAKELNNIIEEVCPAISKRYLKLMDKLVKDIEKITKESNKGIIITNSIVNFVINPKKRKEIQIKLSRINAKTNKFERTSRRNISYYTEETDFRKMKLSLGADIIQSFDAVVAYYIKRICKILNPKLHIATIFDAFIFSQHMDIYTFKNICRLACQISLKQNFVDDIIKINSIPSDDFYKSFNKNIYEPLQNNRLERLIESNFMFYLLKNQSEWYIEIVNPKPKTYLNKNFFIKSLSLMDSTEKSKYDNYINFIMKKNFIKNLNKYYTIFGKVVVTPEENLDKNIIKKLQELEDSYNVRFVLKEIIDSLNILYENFYTKDANTVISRLREIMNNDDFIK